MPPSEYVAHPADGTPRQASEIGPEAASAGWAVAARDVLIETAGRYHAVITTKELSAETQRRADIHTTQQTHHWIGKVLRQVSQDCQTRGEPLLSSLCVNTHGSVGEGYAELVSDLIGDGPGDHDDHAAGERLLCYRQFEAVGLPAGGGTAALTPVLSAKRSRDRQTRKQEAVLPTCPICFLELARTGKCDNCDS